MEDANRVEIIKGNYLLMIMGKCRTVDRRRLHSSFLILLMDNLTEDPSEQEEGEEAQW